MPRIQLNTNKPIGYYVDDILWSNKEIKFIGPQKCRTVEIVRE